MTIEQKIKNIPSIAKTSFGDKDELSRKVNSLSSPINLYAIIKINRIAFKM